MCAEPEHFCFSSTQSPVWAVMCWEMFSNEFSVEKRAWFVAFADFHAIYICPSRLISRYQGDVPEHRIGKGCEPLAPLSRCEYTSSCGGEASRLPRLRWSPWKLRKETGVGQAQ